MRVEHPHALGEHEARRRLDAFLDEMMGRQPPGGVTIKSASRWWEGNRMVFSVQARRGFFGTTVSGSMVVTDDMVIVESDLPAIIRSFIGEEPIAEGIRRQLGSLLG
ncbi:MAG: polyhydroxyalkanoic acid system family protein [Vicinamibacterales bacterium]